MFIFLFFKIRVKYYCYDIFDLRPYSKRPISQTKKARIRSFLASFLKLSPIFLSQLQTHLRYLHLDLKKTLNHYKFY